jgi:transcriptional regulator
MYVPPMYRARSHRQTWAVVTGYPLALLVTNGAGVPYATHLAAVAADGDGDGDEIVGASILGHLNRANPHWSALTDGMSGKLVFSGPNAYISPVVYDPGPAAPTWNFVAVHVVGRLRLITDREETLTVVRRTAALLEKAFGGGWDQRPSVDYFRSIVGGVGAFELEVESVDAMFKLSQEKHHDIQRRIASHLTTRGPGSPGGEIGQLAGEFLSGVADEC